MSDAKRVDVFLDALEEDWRRQRSIPRANPSDRSLCEKVHHRNALTFASSVAVTALTGFGCWRLLLAVAELSRLAQVLGIVVIVALGLFMVWLAAASFLSMRLAAWATWYSAHDANVEPEVERVLLRDGCVGLEFRPPLSLSRPLRQALQQ